MTSSEMWEEVSTKHGDLLVNLYERWLDEREYEDINDYLDVIKKKIPQATKMTKRPFGVKIPCDNGVLAIALRIKGNRITIEGVTTRYKQQPSLTTK